MWCSPTSAGGLQESTSTFAQFSRQTGSDDDEEERQVLGDDGSSNRTSKQRVVPPSSADVPTKKKTVVKKPKVVKYNFDEFVREVSIFAGYMLRMR